MSFYIYHVATATADEVLFVVICDCCDVCYHGNIAGLSGRWLQIYSD